MNKPETYQWAVDGPPIGVWRTNSGKATATDVECANYLPNGVASLVEHSSLFADETISLLWRVLVPGELQLFEGDEDYPLLVASKDCIAFSFIDISASM